MMTEQPDLKLQEVSDRCGFSSRQVFARVFARETGFTPSEWISSLGQTPIEE